MGFEALATTSSGFAMTLGRLDGSVTPRGGDRDTRRRSPPRPTCRSRPTSRTASRTTRRACAETLRLAGEAGLAGASIEDAEPRPRTTRSTSSAWRPSGSRRPPRRRTPARRGSSSRRGRRTTSTERATWPTRSPACRPTRRPAPTSLFAPGLRDLEEIRARSSTRSSGRSTCSPGRDGPSVAELASAGVSRVSVGGAFAFAALGAAVEAARELLDEGTCGFWERSRRRRPQAARSAFAD